MSVKFGFHSACKGFDSLMVLEVNRIGCAHFLCEFQTFFLSVHRYDVVDAHRTQDSDADQADGSTALHYHSAVKTEDSCGFRSFHRVDENGAGLNEDSGIQIQIAYVEHSRASADKQVI